MFDCDIETGEDPAKKVYISGPITGKPYGNADLFGQAAAWVTHQGHIPINPHWLKHNHGKTWLEYMREDLKAMMDCDEILMLPGFTESKGAMVEHELARALGLPIKHYLAG
jgi:hypothetical protein